MGRTLRIPYKFADSKTNKRAVLRATAFAISGVKGLVMIDGSIVEDEEVVDVERVDTSDKVD